jgi:hypothetical protein
MQSPSIRKIERFWYSHEFAIRFATFVVLLADAIRQIAVS